jgi:hypothetical protein
MRAVLILISLIDVKHSLIISSLPSIFIINCVKLAEFCTAFFVMDERSFLVTGPLALEIYCEGNGRFPLQ